MVKMQYRNRRYRCPKCGKEWVDMRNTKTFTSYCEPSGKTVRVRWVKL